MPRRDLQVPLRHMLDHAREAIASAQGKTRNDLDANRLPNLALVRLLEVIGEAAGRISKEDQKRLPGIPWPEIVSLRNRLIHGYDSVDFDVLWQIVSKQNGRVLEGETWDQMPAMPEICFA